MSKYVSYCNEILDQYLSEIKKFDSIKNRIPQDDEFKSYESSITLNYKPICDLIKQAVKFKMSDGGMLLKFGDDVIGFLKKFVDEVNLPFDIIALEFPKCFTDDFIQVTEQVLLAKQDDDYIYIYVLIKNDTWVLPEEPDCTPIHFKLDRKNFSYEISCSYEDYNISEDKKQAFINSYSWIGIGAFVNFICALSCSNTVIEDHPDKPSRLKNDLRRKKGKLPLFTHKILTIDAHKSPTQTGGSGNGSHNSPRVHLRRGHIRRLPNKNVWVNACVVGDKSKGVIHKDYIVV